MKKYISFFLVVLFVLLLFKSRGLAELLIFISSLAVHETAHILCALFCEIPINNVSLSFLGAKITTQHKVTKENAIKYFFIYFLGPFTNILFAVIILIASQLCYINKSEFFIFYNLLIACINLIPAYPLDGGRMCECLLILFISTYKSKKIVIFISFLISILFLVLGLYIFVFKLNNFLLILLGVTIILNAKKEMINNDMTFLNEKFINL